MIYVDSLIAYLAAWIGAFSPSGRENAPLSVPRLAVLALFPVFLLLQILQIAFLAVDHLLFPRFRDTPIKRPVFVIGVPRSGTTFLHRRLAADSAFTAPQTWEVLGAPSISLRYVVRTCARIDRALGAPVARGTRWLAERWVSSVSEVHPVGIRDAEEDYLGLLPAGGCFFAYLLFPHAAWFRSLAHLDTLPEARRERLLQAYHRLLQRQVYAHAGAQLLSKNAAFASWGPYLRNRYPDAVFVICIRAPEEALASQLTSLRDARAAFASFPEDAVLEAEFVGFYQDWYAQLATFTGRSDTDAVVIEQEWLRGNTHAALQAIYARLERSLPSSHAVRPATASESAARLQEARAPRPIWQIGSDAGTAMRPDYLALCHASVQREDLRLCS